MVLIEIKPFRKFDMKWHSNFSKGLSFVERKGTFISVDQKQKWKKRDLVLKTGILPNLIC